MFLAKVINHSILFLAKIKFCDILWGKSKKNNFQPEKLCIYKDFPKLSPLVRVLSWTHNLIILSRCKGKEERERRAMQSQNRFKIYSKYIQNRFKIDSK
jgi:hypothetical protein